MWPENVPPELSFALKEGAAVCRAVGEGKQIVLLRKGGIVERGGGFALECPWFFLLPTSEQPDAADLTIPPNGAPGGPPQGPFPVTLLALGEAFPVRSLETARSLRPFTVYSDPFIEKRWIYRPDRPLFAVLLLAFRRMETWTVPADPRYAGCVSWTELASPVPTGRFSPVLDRSEFDRRRDEVVHRLK
jgi:hypothetical protein